MAAIRASGRKRAKGLNKPFRNMQARVQSWQDTIRRNRGTAGFHEEGWRQPGCMKKPD